MWWILLGFGFVWLVAVLEHESKETQEKNYWQEIKSDNQTELDRVRNESQSSGDTLYDINHSSRWEVLRQNVKNKYGGKCTDCGTNNPPLQVHHIIPLSIGGDNKIENLTLLCRNCHQKHHKNMISNNPNGDDMSDYGFNYKINNSKIAKLIAAVKNQREVRIVYIDKSGVVTDRNILPHGIIEDRGCYYVRAYCNLRADGRTFRVSRIKKVSEL